MTEAWSNIILAGLAYLFWWVDRPDKKKESK